MRRRRGGGNSSMPSNYITAGEAAEEGRREEQLLSPAGLHSCDMAGKEFIFRKEEEGRKRKEGGLGEGREEEEGRNGNRCALWHPS